MVATTTLNPGSRPAASDSLSRLQRRDPAAFEALVREHSARLHAVAARMLRCEDAAADAVQEAFVAALGSIDRFRGESSAYTWLYRIVVNACLMKLRSRRATSCEAMTEFVAAPADGDPLVADETAALVRRCIEQLPNDYRTVLALRDLEERDTHETARLLRTSPGAVKTRLHRARAALRALLEPSLGA